MGLDSSLPPGDSTCPVSFNSLSDLTDLGQIECLQLAFPLPLIYAPGSFSFSGFAICTDKS